MLITVGRKPIATRSNAFISIPNNANQKQKAETIAGLGFHGFRETQLNYFPSLSFL